MALQRFWARQQFSSVMEGAHLVTKFAADNLDPGTLFVMRIFLSPSLPSSPHAYL